MFFLISTTIRLKKNYDKESYHDSDQFVVQYEKMHASLCF